MRFVLFSIVLVAVGCSNAEPTSTEATSTPVEVTADWLSAVAAVDEGALEALVEPVGLVVVAAVENQLRSDETVALLEAGTLGAAGDGYWRSFRDDFEAIRGVAVDSLSVGYERDEDLGPDYAAVAVSIPDSDGIVVLQRSEGEWQVDMVGSLGPALVDTLGSYLESALGGSNATAIAEAYRVAVIPGLDAAIAIEPTNSGLVFGTEHIRQLLIDQEQSAG